MWPFKYPYTNFHELNLDWILNEIQELKSVVSSIPASTGNDVFATPQEFGAVADGSTDCTESFAKALASGKPIFVPNGRYLVHNLEIPSGCMMVGQSRESVVFSSPNGGGAIMKTSNFDQLRGSGAVDGTFDAALSNFTIDGRNYGGGIIGFAHYGTRNVLHNIVIANCDIGIYSEWCNQLGLVGNHGTEAYFDRITVNKCHTGIEWHGPHDSMMENIIVALGNTGITISDKENSTAAGTNWNQCHVYANTGFGIVCTSANVFTNVESETSGYQAPDADCAGFDIRGNCTLTGCRAHFNNGDGFRISGIGNKVDGWTSNNSKSAINFPVSCSQTLVTVVDSGNGDIRNIGNADMKNCNVKFVSSLKNITYAAGHMTEFELLSSTYEWTNNSGNKQVMIITQNTGNCYITPKNGTARELSENVKTIVLLPYDKVQFVNAATFLIRDIV